MSQLSTPEITGTNPAANPTTISPASTPGGQNPLSAPQPGLTSPPPAMPVGLPAGAPLPGQPPFPPVPLPGQPPFIPVPGAFPMPGMAPIVPPVIPVITAPTPKDPAPETPSNTLYIRNIDEKVKIPKLKKELSSIFQKYGKIVEIVAHANLRMRGQAFIVYDEEESATKALEEAQHFVHRNRQLLLQYSKGKSDAIVKREGEDQFEEHKKRRLEEKGMYSGDPMFHLNKILFIQNIPAGITEAMLTGIFQTYMGFKEVRLVPGKLDIAFVEYDNEHQAAVAKEALKEYEIQPGHKVHITFAKK
ncbi:RNA-binding domain-containing protein [Basidiobolus meristosporus CBS 931.73]|uniref:RNA-binding domain-containing protein n=1 Tax=Basidiobolus meristosporus CBS 931.73 TaxID=1314790 RepID=A0A1Y1VQV5_9FUNG|nr:RNA-binding domain-containing protein [Basidiobolus meristosporus CBS 931.73]|eukprot:ORX63435.1 RNA-binding domain-containing protein [Basidiobolus meristosporus CBS 931.73]